MILHKLLGFALLCFPSHDPFKVYLMMLAGVFPQAPETNLKHDWMLF